MIGLYFIRILNNSKTFTILHHITGTIIRSNCIIILTKIIYIPTLQKFDNHASSIFEVRWK